MSARQAIRAINFLELHAATMETGDSGNRRLAELTIGGTYNWKPLGGGFKNDPYKCRLHTVLLVTDGSTQPLAEENYDEDDWYDGYVPFVMRTDPVHVLDVGIGDPESSDWLIELADNTGGTYSYVPTATDLDNWIDDVKPYEWEAEVADTVDTDADGVPDNVEIRGVVATTTRFGGSEQIRMQSDPYDSDTDDDGLFDGEELGAPASASLLGLSSNAGSLGYIAVSNPRYTDSDFDGLDDIEEYEYDFDALRRDIDHDRIDDGEEVLWNTSPHDSDSDRDGFSDGFEIIQGAQLGFDPTVWDDAISDMQWLADMSAGFICGEFCFVDSMGWLTGNIVSGLLAFGDARDIVAYAISGSWISLAFTAVGIIPVVGDVIRAINAAIKFIRRTVSTRNANAAVTLVSELAQVTPFERALLMDEFGEDIVSKLVSEGLEDSARMGEVIRLVGPTDIAALLDDALLTNGKRLLATKNPSSYATPWVDGFQGVRQIGREGEAYVKLMRGIAANIAQIRTAIPGTSKYRYYDIIDGTLHIEVKTGRIRATWFVRRQIARDALMVMDGKDVLWVFVGNSKTGIGPDPALLALLIEKNIPFEIHWPG